MQLAKTIKGNQWKSLLALAVLFTLLNAFKPLCIDDALYYYRARQVAEHPLDPYGFTVFWNDRPEPAIQVLAPPLFPYYWAPAIHFFGERPVLWKLWLFPLALLLVSSLYALFRRFAPGHELWLTWMTIISPVFLPSFNLMLEVPVAALSVLALNLFLRASDRNSFAVASLAGLINGLAMETKYTALITVGVVLVYALIFRRLRLGLLAAMLAVLVFAAIEALTAWRYGHSHFLYQSGHYGSVNPWKKYVYLAWPLVTLMGALAPGLALLGWTALKVRRRFVIAAAVIMMLGYLLLAIMPEQYQVFSIKNGQLGFAHLIFSLFGIAVYGTLVAVIWRLCGPSLDRKSSLNRWRDYPIEWFLALWWLLEIGGYFALSPIPAARRLPGLLIVSLLLVGRLASRMCVSSQCRRLLKRSAVGSMALGLLFYTVDLRDATAEKTAVEQAAQKIAAARSSQGSGGDVWYVGRWGFQYYAERAGMKPVVADESMFHEGDLLVISDGAYFPQLVAAHISRYKIEPMGQLSVADSLPLQTMMGYYNSGIPLTHHEGPRRSVSIYRIVSDSPSAVRRSTTLLKPGSRRLPASQFVNTPSGSWGMVQVQPTVLRVQTGVAGMFSKRKGKRDLNHSPTARWRYSRNMLKLNHHRRVRRAP